MLLHRFYDAKLAQASFLVGCQSTGEAIIIDPNRDVEQYLTQARVEGLHITHVTETHIHADFVSGARELAGRTGARLLLSGEGGVDWQYAFAEGDGATLLHDRDELRVGNVRLQVLHTPGHTPEHLTFLLTDLAATDQPMGAFTGDFIFVGDVGRPDLLERAAGEADTMEASARTLYQSLQRFRAQPDHLQLWPGHGAGSACGRSLGAVPTSTLGYERQVNWAFADMTEEQFVERVLTGQPEPPRYFAMMKRINREGPSRQYEHPAPHRLDAPHVLQVVGARDTVVVDLRPAVQVAHAYVPGTINIPMSRAFPTWAGALLPYDRTVYLIAADEDGTSAREAVHDLSRIGIDRVGGWFPPSAVEEWANWSGRSTETIQQVDPDAVARDLEVGRRVVVDVRGREEWSATHIPGATNIPLAELDAHLGELAPDDQVVVHCQSGLRSAIAASLLKSHGVDAVNLAGGMAEWERRGLPVERADAPPSA